MKNPIRIDMILRSDAAEKSGGDSLQVDQYVAVLTKLGFDVECFPFSFSMNLRSDSIVHIVNVDRPFDFLSSIRMAMERPVVVSTIHHDLDSVRLMRKAEKNQGARTVVGRILPESGRELVAFAVRTGRRVKSASDAKVWLRGCISILPSAVRVWRTVGRTLDSVDTVALLADGEREALRRDTKWLGNNGVLIPNGSPSDQSSTTKRVDRLPWQGRRTDVCVAGRIEPRKRQLEIATEAARLGLQVVFVGHPSPSSPRYVEDFEAVVAASENLTWVGGVEHSQVLDIMESSRVMLNASWVEVQSLVDIEGASVGCWVVVGRGGNSKEWLSENVVAVDTHEIAGILSGVENVLTRNAGPAAFNYVYTWEMAGNQLADIYSRIRVGV